MYIAPGHGHTTTWYKFWQIFKAFIISIILYQCLLPHYFIWYFVLFHACTGRQPMGTIFYGSRKVLSFWSLVACFKVISLFSDIMHIFHDFIHVYSPGRGRQPIVAKILMSTGRPHQFQKNLWFYAYVFMLLYMYIVPGQELTTPWGQNFDVNRNILSLRFFDVSFFIK